MLTPNSLHCFRMLRPYRPFCTSVLFFLMLGINACRHPQKKYHLIVSSPTFSRNFHIDFSSSSLFSFPKPPNAFSMFFEVPERSRRVASCFHCYIRLGLTSNSFESSANVICSLIAAKATIALNLFVNFLRFVVIRHCEERSNPNNFPPA